MTSTDGMRADWATKDFYKVLGVSKDADASAIKKAYRRLARENHPDSNPGDSAKHEKFKAVAEAYDVVGDADKRKKYDDLRANLGPGGFGGFGRGGFGGGGGGFNPGSQGEGINLEDLLRQARQASGQGQGQGHAGQGGFATGFGDLLGDVFGGGRTRTQPRQHKGQDVEASATIGFMEAQDGVTISLRLSSDAPCTACKGTGGKPGTTPHVCLECEGAGFVVGNVGGAFTMNETCSACGGRQLIYDHPCPICSGTGRGSDTRTVHARIPAGVKDGQRIRLKGKGGPGENGGPAGDLMVTVKVRPHPVFERKDDNLLIDVPVSFPEAALGAEIKLPTLTGASVTLKVPAGTPNGRTFRVRGKGAQRKDGTYGDLLATVSVQVPATLSTEAKEALEKFRDATKSTSLREGLFKS